MAISRPRFKTVSDDLMALGFAYNGGGILGELVPRMMWNCVVLRCIEAADFIDFYCFWLEKFMTKNGFEIRCTGNST